MAGKHVCATPRCPAVIPVATSTCGECRRKADAARGPRERYSSAGWTRNRANFLAAHPICALGSEPSYTPDHFPVSRRDLVARGEPNPDAWQHLRPLCDAHHRSETARLQPGGWNAQRPVLVASPPRMVLVTGAPCAGKSTYVAEHAQPSDLVIDHDAIVAALGGGYGDDVRMGYALDAQDAILSRARTRPGDVALLWLIRCAPTQAERERATAGFDASIVVLDPGFDECMRRALHAQRPSAWGSLIMGWFAAREAPTHATQSGHHPA